MAWANVNCIDSCETSPTFGNLIIRFKVTYVQNSGIKQDDILELDLPISATNWKQQLGDAVRARMLVLSQQTISPNDLLFQDLSRG